VCDNLNVKIIITEEKIILAAFTICMLYFTL